MTPDQIKTVLTAHKQWFDGEQNGIRANLTSANLTSANLSGAILSGAILRDGIKAKRLVGLATRGIDSYIFHCIETDSESDRFYYIAGCRSFTRQEFERHIESEYPGTEKASKTRACLDYLESLV